MKNINELTELEILLLTNANIEDMISYCKAEEGIAIIKPVYKDVVKIDKPNTTIYSILGFNYYFTDKDIAEKVRDFMNSIGIENMYNYSWASDIRYFYPITREEFDVSSDKMYIKAKFLEIKDIVDNNKKIIEENNKLQEVYESNKERSNEIEEEIWNRVIEVKDKYDNFKRMTDIYYVTYIPLSENNAAIAMNFLKKAYKISEECERYILDNEPIL